MKLKNVSFVLAGLCLFGLVLLSCPEVDENGDNTKVIEIKNATQVGGSVNSNQDGLSTSKFIVIKFSAAVKKLLKSEVNVTGAAVISGNPEIDENETAWLIPITVSAYGTAQVTIHRKGIDDSPKSVVVYKEGVARPNIWTVQADGGSGVQTSTQLTFVFDKNVTGLLMDNITVTREDGNAILKVKLLESTTAFRTFYLTISVTAEEDLSVQIDQEGIDPFPQTVRVFFYAPPVEGGTVFNNPVPQPAIDPSNPYTKAVKNVVPRASGGSYTPVVHEVWMGIDTNTDPRCPIGYKLRNSQKQFFENVVIFHSDLQWDHISGDVYKQSLSNDAGLRGGQQPNECGFCPQTRPHHHEPPRLQWLLANYDEYLQPIKDAGMRLLICPLPAGQGYSYGHIGAWPGSSAPTGTGGGWNEVMGERGAVQFAEALVDWCLKYGFDGIALDDEYADAADIPHRNTGYSNYNNTAYANIVRFLKYFKAISAAKNYRDPITGKAGMWVSAFNYRFSLPNNVTISQTQAGYHDAITAGTFNTNDIVDIAYPSQYGPTYTSRPFGLRASQWCHITVAFDAFSAVTTPPGSVKAMATTMLTSGYGCVMYFALRERSFYNGRDYFMNGIGSQPEYWLTEMSKVLYRDGVDYDGPDFPKFPQSYAKVDDVRFTGALYAPGEPGKTTPKYTWP